MRILYIARHQGHDNDDEGAVAHALTQLGHEVNCQQERADVDPAYYNQFKADFCLMHTWDNYDCINAIRIPKTFWYFDLIANTSDPSLAPRMARRRDWASRITGCSLVFFCTDGDWVAQDPSGKCVHLMQGADERKMGKGTPLPGNHAPILFMGMVNHGLDRANHIAHLEQKWGALFEVFGNRGPRFRKHGRELADIIASRKIIIAPSGPNTNLYASNRIFLTTGFQGFLMHPRCDFLKDYYRHCEEVVFYRDWDELDNLISIYLKEDEDRERIARNGFIRTQTEHLYRHRCQKLIEEVKRRL